VGALVATDGGPITGRDLAVSMRTTFGAGGTRVALTADAGVESSLREAVDRIRAGQKIDYYGAAGSINFDDAGSTRHDTNIRCVGPAPANASVNTGVFYSPTTQRVEGVCGGSCAATVDGGACPPAAPADAGGG
jgi:hypothetical protein